MKKVLLHICCGVCAASCIIRLKEEGFQVAGFFYNPNIHPYEEYLRRKEIIEKLKEAFYIPIYEAEYNTKNWFALCFPFKDELEGGKRCLLCYELRLRRTYKLLKEKQFDYFTTTLTVSPHKKSKLIFEVGEKIDKDKFLPIDFKKKDGFKKSINFAKEHNLYRQHYCGCLYSLEERGCSCSK